MGLLIQELPASDLGGYSGTSNRMSQDPLAAGTGGISLFANTSDNAYAQNPASQAWSSDRNFSAGTAQLALDRFIYSLQGGVPLPPTAHLNLGLIAAGTRHIEARDSRGYYAGELEDTEMTYLLAFSNRFSDKLAFGLSFKILSKHFSSDDGWLDLKGTGFGASVGISYKALEHGRLALAIKDWNSGYKWKTQDLFERGSSYQDVFPMSLAYGWEQELGNLQVAIEHDHYFIGEDIFRAALMYTGLRHLTLNTGLSLADGNLSPGVSARYDLSLKEGAARIHIDLGISGGIAHEGLRNYLGWGVNF